MATIKELKEFIKDLPDDMEVMTADSEWGTEESSWEISETHKWDYNTGKRSDPIKYLRIS